MADVETSIRITAETKAALQNLAALDTQMGVSARAVLAASNNAGTGFSRIDNATNVLSKRSIPALGGAFGAVTSQALSMTTGFSGASGVMAMLGQTAFTLTPILGGVMLAAAALTSVLIKKKISIEELTTVIEKNRTALDALTKGNDEFARIAREVIAVSDEMNRTKIAETEEAIRRLNAGEDELTFWNLYKGALNAIVEIASGADWLEALSNIGKLSDEERIAALSRAAAALAKYRAALSAIGEAQGPPAPTNYEMAQEAKAEAAKTEAKRRQAEDAALKNRARQAALEMDLEYHHTSMTMLQDQGAEYQRLQDIAIGTTQNIAKAEVAKNKAILTANQMRVVAVAQGAAKMLLLEKKNIGEVLAAVMAGVAAELSAKAILWAAEGLALMFTPGRQGEAGAKFAAAAAAGVGSAALATISSSFEKDQGAQASAGNAAIGGASGGGGSTGRTLVSQGPMTLYYNATLVVNGHVFDKTDIYAEFDLWNQDQLRRAGVDLSQRAR